MTVYIYGLHCPIADCIRYIGKSTNPATRFKAHIGAACRGSYNHHTARWIRKIVDQGVLPTLVVLREVADGERWQDAERQVIAEYLAAGAPLTNSTAGGEGLDYLDPEDNRRYRENLSASLKELWNRPERREEARQRSLAAWNDPEVTARRLASMKQAYLNPLVQAKNAAQLAALRADPDAQLRRLEASRLAHQSPEVRAKLKEAWSNPVLLQDQADRVKARWQDPEAKAKMQDARWTDEKKAKQAANLEARRAKMLEAMTPEARAKQAEKMKAKWADPEFRAKVAATKAAKKAAKQSDSVYPSGDPESTRPERA